MNKTLRSGFEKKDTPSLAGHRAFPSPKLPLPHEGGDCGDWQAPGQVEQCLQLIDPADPMQHYLPEIANGLPYEPCLYRNACKAMSKSPAIWHARHHFTFMGARQTMYSEPHSHNEALPHSTASLT